MTAFPKCATSTDTNLCSLSPILFDFMQRITASSCRLEVHKPRARMIYLTVKARAVL